MLVYKGVNNLYSHEYSKELQHFLQEDCDESRFSDTHTHFSYMLEKALNQSGIGELLEIFNFLLTIIEIFFYIISTYTYPEDTDRLKSMNSTINIIEIYLSIILIILFAIKFYTNQSRLLFVFEFVSFIDYSTWACILIAQQKFVSNDWKYFLRLFRMIRIFYLFRLEYILQKRYNETVRYSYKLIIYLITIIFLSTSLILEIENWNFRKHYGESSSVIGIELGNKSKSQLYQFHDMIYFELVTLATIGFGDITPKTWQSRIIVIATIIAILVIVLPIYSKWKIIFALTSKYSRISYQRKSQRSKHWIVLGECGVESFEAFWEELYNDDHGSTNYDTVIMQSTPNDELMKLVDAIPTTNKICYWVGNSLVHKDLERCWANKSICAVILANKLAKNPRWEDFSNIMKAFSFRKFNYIFGQGEDTRICIQWLRPETKEIYFSSWINNNEVNSRDQIICVEEIKLQLLGKSCWCPGITTIISSLITSKKPLLQDEEMDKLPWEMRWLNEYWEGIQVEIYVVTWKAELVHNLKFIDVVKMVYEVSGSVVIGIDVIIDDLKPFVCLNPASYWLSPFDHWVYIWADQQPDETELNNQIVRHLEKQGGIVENNKEMVKWLRMKNPYWSKMHNPDNNKYSYQAGTNEVTQKRKPMSGLKKFSSEQFGNLSSEKESIKGARRNWIKRWTKANTNKITHDNPNIQNNQDNSTGYKKKWDMFTVIKQNFLHTILPRTQHEAETISPDILDHHIIVCGIGWNWKNLLMPLRASSMKNQQYPIVIIDKAEHIPSEIWKEIQYYPDIYFMQGNPIKAKDLYKAGIKKAKAVIIWSKSTTDIEQADMVDADTIFIYRAIKNETKTAWIIAEWVSVSSIGFLSSAVDDSFIRKQGYWVSEPFAVGEIYISSMLDTLICQSFYNPYITDILQQLIMGSASSTFSVQVQNKLQEKKISQSTLYLLNISEEIMRFGNRDFTKKVKYKEIFEFFIKHNMIPIGINRNSSKINTIRSKTDKRYVYLCPKSDSEIDIDHDKIYILAGEEYMSNEKSFDGYKKKNNNFYQFNQTSKLIDKSNELVLDLAQSMKKLIDANSWSFKKSYSVKKVVNCIRSSMRNELANMHDLLAEEDENESENSDSGKNSSNSSKSGISEEKSNGSNVSNKINEDKEDGEVQNNFLNVITGGKKALKKKDLKKKENDEDESDPEPDSSEG